MKRHRIVLTALGLAVILGLPPALMVVAGPSPTLDPPAAARPGTPEALRALVESRSGLSAVYDTWEARYVAHGGDQDVDVPIGWVEGLSTEPSRAQGRVHLDLVGGAVRAEVSGLAEPADLWLVDNQPGPGRSVLPEPGDRFVHVAALRPDRGGTAYASVRLDADLFHSFELDLAVVSRAGETPATSRLLVGSRGLFERLYTRTRLAAERQRRERSRSSLANLVTRSLAGLFSPRPALASASSVLVAHKLVSRLVADGGDLFFHETFSGNGRTCNTCHSPSDNQALDPDFIATLPSTDKLFMAEMPADQGGVPGLERPALMHSFGLILENVDGAEDPTHKFVMRGVPHSLSLATSILAPDDGRAPVERSGWSGDDPPGNGALRLFPVGATQQHFTRSLARISGVDFVLPTDAQLDAMEAFMLSCGRLNDLDLTQVSLTDPGAANGQAIFTSFGKCSNCHGNAGAIAPGGANENFNTGVELVPHPARTPGDPRFVEDFPFDGGFGKSPFDTDGDGVADSFGDGTFNVPPLVEAADNAPFFHNNVMATLEDAVRFYSGPQFNASPAGQDLGGIRLTDQESDDVAAFLRVLNAGFNIDIALQRTTAAIALENASGDGNRAQGTNPGAAQAANGGARGTANTLLALANVEGADALEVLGTRNLNPNAIALLQDALSLNQQAIDATSSNLRKSLMLGAAAKLRSAKADLGTGMDFVMGEGNLLF